MPNITSDRVKLILDLPFVLPLNGVESTAVVQAGVTKQAKISDIGTYTKLLDYSSWVYANSSVGTFVNANSSNDLQANSWVFRNSSYNIQGYTWVFKNSSYDLQANTWVFANSSTSTWVNNNSSRILFNDLGGAINGNLLVYGNLSAFGDTSITNLNIGSTSAIVINNTAPTVYSLLVNQASGSIGVASFNDGSLEVLHVGAATDIYGNETTNGVVGIKTSTPNKTLTVNGDISASGNFFGVGTLLTNLDGNNIIDSTIPTSKLTGNLNVGSLIANNSIYGKQLTSNAQIVAQQLAKTSDVVNGITNIGLSGNQITANANIVATQLSPRANIVATQLASNANILGTQLTTGTVSSAQIAPNAAILPTQLSTGHPTWDTSSNLGIGTTTPAAKLDISGSSNTTQFIIGPNSSGSKRITFSTQANGLNADADLNIASNSQIGGFVFSNTLYSSLLRIDPTGKIGINNFTPSYPLDVNGQTRLTSGLAPVLQVVAQGTGYSDPTNGVATIFSQNNTGAGGNVLNVGSTFAPNTFIVKDNGNVGIGTSTPSTALDVNGDITIRGTGKKLYLYNYASNNQAYIQAENNGDVTINGGVNAGPNEILRASGNGNVGIGTSSPGQKLDVNGAIRASGEIIGTSGGAGQARFIQGNYGVIHRNDGSNYYILLTNSGDQYGQWNSLRPFTIQLSNGYVNIGNGLTVGGTITATGDVVAYSDERLKENVKTIENALDKVNQLRGVEYTRKKDGKEKIGVIAQEVEKILPQVISEETEYKAVDYGNIVAVLIEAVKELSAEVKDLKEQLSKSK